MQFDRFVHIPCDLVTGPACCRATGQIRRVRGIVPIRFFNHNEETPHEHPLVLCFLETRVLENAIQGSGCQVVTEMSGNRDASGFCRVLVLPMAPLRDYQVLAISFD